MFRLGCGEAIWQRNSEAMKALTLNGYEGLASLRFAEVATPEPGPNDVLVKVKAASVNPVDTKIARGYGGPSQRPLPHVLGRDCAGTVAKVGSAVTGFKVGDEVYGVADAARWGTFAEYVVMPAATTSHRPAGLSDVDAGSIPDRGPERLGRHRHHRQARPGPARAHSRRRWRRRQLRGAIGQAHRRHRRRHRGRQEHRFRAFARRRPGDRLHQGRLQRGDQGRRSGVRPDRRRRAFQVVSRC